MTPTNATIDALDAGDPALGAWILSASPRAAEVLARTELDWIGIDTEHAPVGAGRVEELVRAVEGAATPIVRLPGVGALDSGAAKRALDAGAGGVIVPAVESGAQAERAVEAASFPPRGTRGVAGTTRANRYGEAFDAYVAGANDATLVVVQIETPKGVERVDDIVSVPGVDVAFVGENDLSAAYGSPGEKSTAEIREAREAVLGAALDAGIAPGIAGRTPEDRRERAERGWQFFLLGADVSFMREGLSTHLPE